MYFICGVALVLQWAVFNYSWSKFPYLRNIISFYIAYESDVAYVEKVIYETTLPKIEPDTDKKIEHLKDFMEATSYQ